MSTGETINLVLNDIEILTAQYGRGFPNFSDVFSCAQEQIMHGVYHTHSCSVKIG